MALVHWIREGVLAGGPHPDPFRDPNEGTLAVEELRQARIGAVVSLTEEPWQPPRLAALEVLEAPTPDGEAPDDLEAICAFIDAARMRHVATFVHCVAGLGRTGTVLAAWLIWSEQLSASRAIEEVRTCYHPRAVETAAQIDALAAFARRHRLL